MAISIVNSAIGSPSGYVVTVAKPTDTAENDLLLAFCTGIYSPTAGQITAPVGWTRLHHVAMGGFWGGIAAFWKLAGSSEASSYDFGYNAGPNTAAIVALRGVLTGAPINASDATVDTLVCPAVTTTVASCTVLRMVGSCRDHRSYTWPVGQTELWDYALDDMGYNDTDNSLAYATQVATGSSGTIEPTPSSTNVMERAAITIAVAPVSYGHVYTFGVVEV